MKRSLLIFFATLLTLSASLGLAAHVTDKLLIGLYQKAKIGDTPLKLITSGTPLEVLKKSKGFSYVRLADGTKGWVEAKYLTEEKPAKMMLLEAQAEVRRLKSQLPESSKATPLASTLPSVREAKLQQNLNQAEQKITELQQGIEELPAALAAQQELADLKNRINGVLGVLAEGQDVVVQAKPLASDGAEDSSFIAFLPWVISVLAVLIGFAAGIAFFDFRIRKRYRGLRL